MSEAEDVAFKEMFPLVIGLLAGLAVFFIVIANIIADSGPNVYAPAGMTPEQAIAHRVAPIGKVNMGGPMLAEPESGAAAEATTYEGPAQVYDAVCAACHDAGIAGAPELGDASVWQQRLEAHGGFEGVYQNALNGLNAMPARGGANISDEQLENAVRYILEESGVSP